MSAQQTPNGNGPNQISLKEYIEALLAEHMRVHERHDAGLEVRLQEHQASHDREHEQTEKAILKSEQAVEKRFESVNEFRNQLKDQAATFARIETLDAVKERVFNLEKAAAAHVGTKAGAGDTVRWIFAALSAALVVVTLVTLFTR